MAHSVEKVAVMKNSVSRENAEKTSYQDIDSTISKVDCYANGKRSQRFSFASRLEIVVTILLRLVKSAIVIVTA